MSDRTLELLRQETMPLANERGPGYPSGTTPSIATECFRAETIK
jgi:hypothetical protein